MQDRAEVNSAIVRCRTRVVPLRTVNKKLSERLGPSPLGLRPLTSGTARARLELPHQGVSSVGERGHRLTERRPPFLGEEQALAVKDANPRGFRKVQIKQVERSRLSLVQGSRRGWHDFSIARGCVP